VEINLPDLRTGYVDLVGIVYSRGERVVVRDLPTRELTGVTLVFEDSEAPLLPVGVGRGVNTALAALEAVSLVAGTAYPHLIRAVAPTYESVLVDPADMYSTAYGVRTEDQLKYVYRALRDDPTTRRAVASIWRASDLTATGDRPCTLTLQFLIRDGRLDMIVNMRSQDVWLGAGMDMFVFGQLRDTLAYALDVAPGRYVHHVGSLHLYERDLDRVNTLLLATDSTSDHDLPRGIRFPAFSWTSAATEANALLAIALDVSRHDRVASAVNAWYIDRMKMVAKRDAERN